MRKRILTHALDKLKRKVLSYVLLVGILLVLSLTLIKLTHYSERMASYNKYMCATSGYEADCKTPLSEEDRLK